MKLELNNVACGYEKHPVLHHVTFSVQTGEICCLLGPNGVGKTTLFKTLLGLLKPLEGQITIDGENTARWTAAKLARHLAYVSQQHQPPFPYQVKDVVALGRISHAGYTGKLNRLDYAIAAEAMADMGITHLANRPYTDVSGGERQLVMVARALAQQPKYLVLDEPTANLDYGNMVRVMSKLRALRDKGYGIIMTTHSPDQAFLCDAKVVLLRQDGTMDFGPAAQVITERSMQEVYGIDVRVVEFYDRNEQLVRLCAPLLGRF
jgi:iron complex transport system ATP-binding protein